MMTQKDKLHPIVKAKGTSSKARKRTVVYPNNRHDLRRKVRDLTKTGLSRWHRYRYEKRAPAFQTTPHFLLRRKILLILACFILLAGVVLRPLSFLRLLWGRRFVVVFVTGFLAGALVGQLAAVCLGTGGRLWYTRCAAPAFVLIAFIAVNALFPIADRLIAGVFGIGPFFSLHAAAYVLTAMELVGIALVR